MHNPRTIVVGLGNPILGDDGVGWRVAQALSQEGDWAREVEVDCLALGGLSLMERLVGYERAIIIDAICTRGSPPGHARCFSLEELPDLKVGRSMGAMWPEEIIIVAVEAEHVYDFSEMLSPAVAAAVPEAVQMVLALLAADPVK
jgi:hydrogenase maturation protease